MRKPISHTLRSITLLLLSLMAVVANAVCPSVVAEPEVWASMVSVEGKSLLNAFEGVDGEDIEIMTTECPSVEGVYDMEGQSQTKAELEVPEDTNSDKDNSSDKTKPSVVTSKSLNEKFSFKGLILPGGLIAAGVIGMEAGLFKGKGESEVKENEGVDFEDVAQYVPAAAYLTMGFIPGIEHKHSFVERSMAAVTAYGMMFLVTRPVKHWIHERRPDLTSYDSFPSGHAAMAFTGAELMRLEYGTGIGLGAYALATTVSVLRICHNRHWFNDVVAGAGMGILCARASYWLLPLERKLFGIKDPKVAVAAFPVCNPQSREFALGCCINF